MNTQKKFFEIKCPLCQKQFRVRKGKPRTLKQWRVSLMNHLIEFTGHHLTVEKSESLIAKYFKSLEG